MFSYDPILWHKSNLIEVNVPMHFQNDSSFKLSIWSDKSQDQFFPNQLRVLCLSGNKQIASCGAVKIGRFNNTWTLWIKSLSNEAITSLRLSFAKVESNPNAVPFLKIYYSD